MMGRDGWEGRWAMDWGVGCVFVEFYVRRSEVRS